MALSPAQIAAIRLLANAIAIGSVPGRPDIRAFIAPEMSPGEGAQHGRNIFLGPGFTPGRMYHEVTHADQERKLGPAYHALYRLIERLGVPYDLNPFERAALAVERRRDASGSATPPILRGGIAYTRGR